MRVLAVDRVDLREAVELVLRDRVLDELVGGQRERVLLLPRLGEGAELALHAADVRLVQVDVLDEVDLVAAAALPAREVGEVAEREQVVRLHESDAVVEVEPLAGEHLLPDRRERVEGVQNGHGPTFPDRRLRASGPRARLCAARRRAVPWPVSVVERHLARLVESAGRGDPHERAVHRPAGERCPHDRIPLRGEEERQGRRPVTEVGAGDLAGLDRGARAVEDVVGDLEGDPEREAVLAESRRRAGTRPRTASRS